TLTFNGTAWTPVTPAALPAADGSTDGYLAKADWTAFDAKLGTSSQAAGDVTGTFSTLLVSKLQGNTLAATAPTAGRVLKFDGQEWVPDTDNANAGSVTVVKAEGPLTVTGSATTQPDLTISPADGSTDGYLSMGDWSTFNAKLGPATQASGDVTGTY